jgi:hypothetical protein
MVNFVCFRSALAVSIRFPTPVLYLSQNTEFPESIVLLLAARIFFLCFENNFSRSGQSRSPQFRLPGREYTDRDRLEFLRNESSAVESP